MGVCKKTFYGTWKGYPERRVYCYWDRRYVGGCFWNGMLLSRKIKLIAAFNHIHIFIDPDPDCEKSFTERKRLFDLPGSSWKDYDRNIISKGGGVFDRAARELS